MGETEKIETPLNYKMKPSLSDAFQCNKIKHIIQNILIDKLQGKSYNVDDVGRWCNDISDDVSAAIKELNSLTRYKHVVQVLIGQQTGAGCNYTAKCCWDAESDSVTSDVFSNASMFCVCTVFGVYSY